MRRPTASSSNPALPSKPSVLKPAERGGPSNSRPVRPAATSSSSTEGQETGQSHETGNGGQTAVDAESSDNPANGVTLQVNWFNSEMSGVQATQSRDPDCTLAEFKTWLIGAFDMVAVNERVTGIVFDMADLEEETLYIDTEKDWQRALRQARSALPEENIIVVNCYSEVIPGARSSWMDDPTYRDLRYRGHEQPGSSADTLSGPDAFLLSNERSAQHASELITSVLSDIMKNMLVNRIPAAKASAADLNFEATNPFGDEADAFAGVSLHAYDMVQSWLTTSPKPRFRDAARAKQDLRKQLGDDAEIIDRLPLRRSEDPLRPGQQREGDPHKAHQVCFLAWSISMEVLYGVVFCCDGCGTGKTHEFIAYLLAATLFWTLRGEPPTKPTLLVCPRTLLEKTYQDLRDQLGSDWDVYKYGEEAGVRKERLLFDPRHAVYTSSRAGNTVVLVTYSQLQVLKDGETERKDRHRLFLRIILDEAQCIRRCDQTRQGKILLSFDAHFKAVFTGSPVVDTVLDFDGYLAFLEFAGWSWVTDFNSTHNLDEVTRSRYDRFRESLATPIPGDRPPPLQDWDSDCSSVDELDAQQITESIEDGWQCSHWPALIRYNGDRPPSLERKDRKKIDGKIIVRDVPAPFKENPYDLYHPQNLNNIKCCSTTAFRHYIARHVTKTQMEDVDRRIVAERIKIILDMLVLSRNLFTMVTDEAGNEVSIAGEMPPATIHTQDLRLSTDELRAYKEREDKYQLDFAEHFEAVALAKKAKSKGLEIDQAKIGSKFAKLSVLCTHIGFSGLDQLSTGAIRARRKEGLPLLTARMKTAGALNPEDVDRPLDSDEEVLRQFLWGSPKMRYMLWEIQRVILGKAKPATHRKILATFQFPRSAEMFLKLVEFVGVRAILLDTNMSPDERHKSIRAFDEEDMPQILITTYALNIAGHDAQHRCATVLHVEPAFNWATEHQAASRVYRFGQEQAVEIIRLFTEGTYQELHESGMLDKARNMFAAFGDLENASEEIEGRAKMSSEEIARSAFGIFRKRVPSRNAHDVQLSKVEAVDKGKGKAPVT
ncbi:hypothetical protein J4E80_006871 [Alternaria sp. BMP 0032]|nr:hypothetical protein J4E80_006871 [Alternaria sp. BMP 0032]